MPRTKRPKPLYQRGSFRLYRRPGRNHEIVWYDDQRKRERSTSAGTRDLEEGMIALDRHYLSTQGVKHCPTCGQVLVGEHAPMLAGVIADYLITLEGRPGHTSARGRLAHVVEYIAAKAPETTVPMVDGAWIERFRKWLLRKPVKSTKGNVLRARSLGAVEGCVMQLAAAINMLPNHKPLFTVASLKEASASPHYRASIETLAAMFRFALAREERHTLRAYLRGAVATWARPDALLGLTDKQWFSEAGVLDLNPPGRRQTKKYRPKVPVAKQFRPYLDFTGQYLPVATLRHAWDPMRAKLGLPGAREAGPKLIRRSMATLARKRLGEERWAQGEMMLGHRKASTSDIYALPDPANLGAVLAVTEAIIDDIEALCPGAFTAGLPHSQASKPVLKVVENG